MRKKELVQLTVLSILLFSIEIFVAHRFLTTQVPGANDFYSRWHGAKILLLEGRDPYGLDVTEEIQPIIQIDPNEVGRGGFNYPLHVIFFFWPLVYLPYDWTQAIWWVILQWLSIGSVGCMLGRLSWKPSPIGIVSLMLMALTFYPVTRSIFLGQFTIWILFFLILTLLAFKQNKNFTAGILFSATSIKPQMILFIGLWFTLWAIGQKRWRFLWGLLSGGAAFFLASWILMPFWPLSFFEDIQRYRRFAGGRNPLQILLENIWPGSPHILLPLLSGILFLVLLGLWWRNWRNPTDKSFFQTLNWTIAIELLITFQTGTTNQVLLMIPLFVWLYSMRSHRKRHLYTAGILFIWVLTWALFLGTIDGNGENVIMFLPLLLLTLGILIAQAFYYQFFRLKNPPVLSS